MCNPFRTAAKHNSTAAQQHSEHESDDGDDRTHMKWLFLIKSEADEKPSDIW